MLAASVKRVQGKLIVTTSDHVLVNMADFGNDLKSKEMCWLRNDPMKTTTHPVVRGMERSEHRHRPRAMQNLYPRSEDAEELTTSQDHQEIIIRVRSFS